MNKTMKYILGGCSALALGGVAQASIKSVIEKLEMAFKPTVMGCGGHNEVLTHKGNCIKIVKVEPCKGGKSAPMERTEPEAQITPAKQVKSSGRRLAEPRVEPRVEPAPHTVYVSPDK